VPAWWREAEEMEKEHGIVGISRRNSNAPKSAFLLFL
jgi:hypothetical protein